MRRLATLSLLLSTGLAVPLAYSQSSDGPAELPPAEYAGTEFVDSKGCAFVRATVNGAVSWVARVDQDRNPLCNFEPTFAWAVPSSDADETVETDVAEAPAESDEVADIVTEEMAEAEDKTDAEAMAEAEAMDETEAMDASEDMAEADATMPDTAAEAIETAMADDKEDDSMSTDMSQEVAMAPAPRRAVTPRPVRAPVAAAPAPMPVQTQPVTRAEACAGKSGIQPNLLSLSTGLPIDCGPASEGVTAPTVTDDIPRLTLAEACSRSAATGIRFTNAVTGEPVVCPQTESEPLQALAPSSGVVKPYIQVGSFAVHSNADRLIARLGDLGLPVAAGRSGRLKIVAAGPFTSSNAQQQALATVRGLGFSDAFLRN